MIAGSVVYWGSDTLAGAVEIAVKLCTHAASCEGGKLVETLAKQAQGPLLCSQIRLKTTCLCCKWKKELVDYVRPKRGNSCWEIEMHTFSLHIQIWTLTQTWWVFFSHTHTHSQQPSLFTSEANIPGRQGALKWAVCERAPVTRPSPEKEDLSGGGEQHWLKG